MDNRLVVAREQGLEDVERMGMVHIQRGNIEFSFTLMEELWIWIVLVFI